MNPTGIKIDPAFRDLIPPLSDAEREQLERSIDADGCRDPLVVWGSKGVLLDGHNRYDYCTKMGYEFGVSEIEPSSETAAKNFVILNQLGRRNLSPKQASILRGKLCLSVAKDTKFQPGESKPAGPGRGKKKQDCKTCSPVSDKANPTTTAADIAAKTGVSERTVYNDAKFAAACDKLGVTEDVVAGRDKRPKEEIIKAARSNNPRPFVCECGEEFSQPVWHCPICAHHWPMSKDLCTNCHRGERPKSERGRRPYRMTPGEKLFASYSKLSSTEQERFETLLDEYAQSSEQQRADLLKRVRKGEAL